MHTSTAHSSARPVEQLLATYSESHQNPTNEIIHFVCVPVIVFTVLGLLWSIHPFVALAASALSLLYYCKLSLPFAAGMFLMAGSMLGLLYTLPPSTILPIDSNRIFQYNPLYTSCNLKNKL